MRVIIFKKVKQLQDCAAVFALQFLVRLRVHVSACADGLAALKSWNFCGAGFFGKFCGG